MTRLVRLAALLGAAALAACSTPADMQGPSTVGATAEGEAPEDVAEGGAPEGGASEVEASEGGVPDGKVFEGTPEEFFAAMIDCYRAAGWNAYSDPDFGGLRVDEVTDDQRPAFMEVRDACTDEVGRLPDPEPLSEAQIREYYFALLETKSCLEAEGYAVDEPPSVDGFVQAYGSGSEMLWGPYSRAMKGASEAESRHMHRVCPHPSD